MRSTRPRRLGKQSTPKAQVPKRDHDLVRTRTPPARITGSPGNNIDISSLIILRHRGSVEVHTLESSL